MRRAAGPPPIPSAAGAKPARAGRREFAALVAATPPSSQVLPYTHVTDAYSLRDILASGELSPTHCTVFGTDLVYMFYGRPAYRAAQQEESNGIDAYWPVCFVLNAAAVVPFRLFPFDSGAFHRGMYADHMYHRMIKEDFEIKADGSSPQRLVNLFWRDERSYYDAQAKGGLKDIGAGTLDFEVKAYRELIASTGRARYDERASSVEAQMDRPIKLNGNTVAVVLPSELASPAVIRQVDGLGALALPFSTVQRHGPHNMVGQIYDVVRDLLSGKHGKVRCW